MDTPEVVRRQLQVLEMLCAPSQTADPRFQNVQACACSLLIRFAERTGAVENLQSVCTPGDCLINARSSPSWGVPTAEFLASAKRLMLLQTGLKPVANTVRMPLLLLEMLCAL